MPTIGITGPRRLTTLETERVELALAELVTPQVQLHVGCAGGVDALARGYGRLAWGLDVHRATSGARYALQKRSQQMVDAVAAARGTLHAWPNQACPRGVTPHQWKGSGTWGTMRYAAHRGVEVVVHPEILPLNVELPSWLQYAAQLLVL